MDDTRQHYLDKLAAIERAARGNHLQRLAFAPLRYFIGMLFSKAVYPATRRSQPCPAPTFFGLPMQVMLPAGLDIYLLGAKAHDSEIRLARFMIRHLEAGMAMLDIGAHFGFFTLLGARLVGPQGKALSVEAASGAYGLLEQNISGLPQVEAFRLAASEAEGTVTFYEFPLQYSEYNTLDKSQFEGSSWMQRISPRAVQVPAMRMDDLLEERACSPQLIKLDVEGAEAQVLGGLTQWLERAGTKWLAMEYLPAERHNDSHRQAARLLQEKGWKCFSIMPDGRLEACADIEGHLKSRKLDSDNLIFHR